MSKAVLVPLDFGKLELLNPRLQNLASDPGSPVGGQFYFNTATKKLRVYDGTSAWVEMGTGGGTMTSVTLTQPAAGFTLTNTGATQTTAATATFALANDLAALEGLAGNGYAVRTGTDTWAQRTLTGTTNQIVISNGDGTVGNPVFSLPQSIHTAADVTFNSVAIAETQTVATAGGHAARVDFVLGLVNGLKWKNSVKVATIIAGTLASSFANGSVVDAVTLVTGDRIAVMTQSTQSENGIYIVQASGAPVRSTDADSWAELQSAAFEVDTNAGTTSGTIWNCNIASGGTLGSTAVTFVQLPSPMATSAGLGLVKNGNALDVNVDGTSLQITADTLSVKTVDLTTKVGATILPLANGGTNSSTAAGARTNLGVAGKYAAAIGDNSSTAIVVTHNLNSQDVITAVYSSTTPWAEVWCDIENTSVNTITLRFTVAPTTGQFRVVVIG